MDGEDPRERAARQEAEKMADRELIADRGPHEAAINRMIDQLRGGGYFHPGEYLQFHFPEVGDLRSRWKKKDGSWREGMGRAVMKIDTYMLSRPPANPERIAKYGKTDRLYLDLLAAGYLVETWPDYNPEEGEFDHAEYFIYEAPRQTK